jgi:RNA polymerase sigma factor (sigma-70 family)
VAQGEATKGVTDDACKSYVAAYLKATNDGNKREADEAFTALAKAVESIIIACSRRWSRKECDDIRQIALMSLVEALPSYDPSRQFYAFARTIIYNRVASAFIGDKTMKRQANVVSLNERHGDGNVSLSNVLAVEDESLERIERRDDAKVLIDRLSPQYFTKIEWLSSQLVYVEGLSYAEAAERLQSQYGMDASQKTVDNAVARFVMKARAVLNRPLNKRALVAGGLCHSDDGWRPYVCIGGVVYRAKAHATKPEALEALTVLRRQVAAGTAGPKQQNVSKHVGVTWFATTKKWMAIWKGTYLGYFDSIEEAVKVIETFRTTGIKPTIHQPASGHRNIYIKGGTFYIEVKKSGQRLRKQVPTLEEALRVRDDFRRQLGLQVPQTAAS